MSLTKQQKKEHISEMQQSVSDAASVVFVSYDALNMPDVNELRDALHAKGCSMRVFPKRLLKLVLENVKVEFNPTEHEGQIAVVWGSDTIAPAKVLHEFAKKRENVQLLAGVLEGSTIGVTEVTALAKLPSHEELLGKLVGVLSGPVRGFASVLQGVPRAAVFVLQAITEEKENSSK